MKQHLKGHCPTITPSNFASALSSLPFFEAGTSLSPKFTAGDMMILQEEEEESSRHAATSTRHEAPDSSCGSSSASLPATYSSESENVVESSHSKDEEREIPVKRKKPETKDPGSVTPLYQQSLIDLSSKLGEIKRRQRRLRLQATILP
jgi:hypothetical protein